MAIMAPAIRLMSSLSYAKKFVLVSVLFLVPLATSIFFLQKKMDEDIAFRDRELASLPALELLLQTQAELTGLRQMLTLAVSEDRNNTRVTQLVLALLLGAVLYFLVGFFISVRRLIASLSADFRRLADGDLRDGSSTVAGDEMRLLVAAFDTMGARFRKLVKQVVHSTEEVASAAAEVDGHALRSARSIDELKQALAQTDVQLRELESAVIASSEQTMTAQHLSRDTSEQVRRGEVAVGQTIDSMQKINASSKHIASIVGIIDEIAFQTNLLALNASLLAGPGRRAGTRLCRRRQ